MGYSPSVTPWCGTAKSCKCQTWAEEPNNSKQKKEIIKGLAAAWKASQGSAWHGKESIIPGFIQTISGNKGTCIKISAVDFGKPQSNRIEKIRKRWCRSHCPWAYNSWCFKRTLYPSHAHLGMTLYILFCTTSSLTEGNVSKMATGWVLKWERAL